MDVILRKATIKDIPAIYSLVEALAIYEKEPEAVTATVADYLADFEAGIFQAHVATIDDKVIGMALYYMTYSTWKGRMLYLEDFVVFEAYRRKGIGQLLFDAVLQEGKDRACKLVKWQVLDWNEPAVRFYEKNKATIEKEWWNCKVFL